MSRDIDAEIATSLFGWKWMCKTVDRPKGEPIELTAIFGPEPWQHVNYNPASWRPSDNAAPRFEDWDRLAYLPGKSRRERDYEGLPRFTEDLNWAMKALNALAKKGFMVEARSRVDGGGNLRWDVLIHGSAGLLVEGRAGEDSVAAGICEFILDAIKREGEHADR